MLLIGYLLLALVVAAVLFYLVVALLPSGLTVTPIRDNRPMELPANRRMRMADLDRLRIPVSLRGYRFHETDELIDRLAAEIQVRDEEIARLRQHGAFSSDQPLDGAAPVETAGPYPAEPEWAVRDLGDQAAAELARELPADPPAAAESDDPELDETEPGETEPGAGEADEVESDEAESDEAESDEPAPTADEAEPGVGERPTEQR